jgi:hypothetical protein
MRSKTADAAARRLRLPFLVATVLLVAPLADSQHKQREDINKRFEDRAKVAATVNESLFALVGSTVKPTDAERFGGETVDQRALAQRTSVQQQFYSAIVSSQGEVLAKAGDVPADVASHATVKESTRAKSAVYSSIMRGPGGAISIESAIAFPTKFGTRIDVSAGPADALAQFLNSFLTRLPTVANAKSYVIDRSDKVIAEPGAKTRVGVNVPDKELVKVARERAQGSYDGNRYFASAPITGTPWRIVLSASKDDLYELS